MFNLHGAWPCFATFRVQVLLRGRGGGLTISPPPERGNPDWLKEDQNPRLISAPNALFAKAEVLIIIINRDNEKEFRVRTVLIRGSTSHVYELNRSGTQLHLSCT
jgi:hypothetical protein